LILGKVPNIKSLLIILITEFIPFVFLFRKLLTHSVTILHIGKCLVFCVLPIIPAR